MTIIKQAHPLGKVICFDEFRHLYYAEDNPNMKFTSATTFIGKFFPRFKFDEISFIYAIKRGLDINQVRQSWIDKREKASELGNRVHEYARYILTENIKYKVVAINEIENAYFKQVRKVIKDLYYFGLELQGSEVILADLNWKIAGMTDIIMRFQNSLHILDLKSSQDIKTSNQFQTPLPPIQHLEDTNLSKYQLQLNLYKYLIENNGYAPWATDVVMRIIHLSEDKYTFIDVPDMGMEIRAMLKEKA